MASVRFDPDWWTDEHSSSWERVKHAIRRDWEQTKGDLADNGVDLNQTATNTIRQALGTQPVPHDGLPNPGPRHDNGSDWPSAERALRYGYGARLYYARDWDEALDGLLRKDWEARAQDEPWHSARHAAKRGWNAVGATPAESGR